MLSDCKLSLKFRRSPDRLDKLFLSCTVAVDPSHTLDVVGDGLTVTVGNVHAPECHTRATTPFRFGSCFRYRTRDPLTNGVVNLRLCPRGTGYQLRYRASKVDLQCLSEQRNVITLQSGDSCGSSGCTIGTRVICGGGSSSTVAPTSTSSTTASPTTSTTAAPPPCGNGRIDPGEQCDPPGTSCGIGGTCSTTCQCVQPPRCGDHSVNQASEDCDPPGTACPAGGSCNGSCQCPHHSCAIECTDHTGGAFRVFDLAQCQNQTGSLFDCGSSGESGNVWQNAAYGHCGLRNRLFDGLSNGHWPRWVCAKCRNRSGYYQASGSENPIPAGGDCVAIGSQLANAFCSQGTRGGPDKHYFGYCNPSP